MKKEKGLGQFFTPKLVAEFMCGLIKKPKTSEVLEPCAGEGVFLEILENLGYNHVTAYEIDDSLQNNSKSIINHGNFLNTDPEKKFDVIIGNPPYVRWKNIDEKIREDFKENPYWKDKINGLGDLLYAFLYYCVDKLNPDGELIFITPLFWTETQHSSFLRKFMIEHGEIDTLITFHEMKIFKNVNTNIIIFKYIKNKQNRKIKTVNQFSKKKLDIASLRKIEELLSTLDVTKETLEGEFEAYSSSQFQNGMPWKSFSPSIKPMLDKIEQSCIRFSPIVPVISNDKIQSIVLNQLLEKYELDEYELKIEDYIKGKFNDKVYFYPKMQEKEGHSKQTQITDFFGNPPPSPKKNTLNKRYTRLGDFAEIGNGMVSGLDSAFKIIDESIYLPNEQQKFIKVLKARNLDQYFHKDFTNYIFIEEQLGENEFKKEFPNFYTKLNPLKSKLEARYDYNRQDLNYWNWVFLRNKSLIEQNDVKIFVPCKERFDSRDHVRFVLGEGKFYATQDVTVIIKKDHFKESIKYILALLNSDTIFIWLKNKGLSRGGVLEFSERPLSIIPIRLINWEDKSEVELHNSIVALVDKILDSKEKQPSKDEIEILVKKLYGLE